MFFFKSLARKQTFYLSCVAFIHACLTYMLSMTRIYTFKSSLLDDGVIAQTFWNILHHNGAVYTGGPPYIAQSWFGFHFTPIELILLPFFTFWPHIALLQIAQSLVIGCTGIIVFYMLKAGGASRFESWAGAILFWLNPFVVSAGVWDFHEAAFGALFITIALLGFCQRRFVLMVAALLLLLLTKEHYGVSVAGFGILWTWRYGEWKRGLMLAIAGIAFLIVLLAFFMPAMHGGALLMLQQSHTSMDRYSWLSLPWPQKVETFSYLIFHRGIFYGLVLLMSGLFLPIAAPLYLIPAGADILANTLATNFMPSSLSSYHSVAIIPVIIFASFEGYKKIRAAHFPRKDLLFFSLSVTAIALCMMGMVIPVTAWEIESIQTKQDTSIQAIDALLPEGGVSAQGNVAVFFAQRPDIYAFPNRMDVAKIIVLYLANPYIDAKLAASPLAYAEPAGDYFKQVSDLMQKDEWHITYWHSPWLVMQRGQSTTDETKARTEINEYIRNHDLAEGK